MGHYFDYEQGAKEEEDYLEKEGIVMLSNKASG